ncbi:hypothetical protein BDC45DRAFT_507980 [Circinella umbellata]|nr:hypothetical protein BDC45DRAFT_507980 [Circinella umbellata]
MSPSSSALTHDESVSLYKDSSPSRKAKQGTAKTPKIMPSNIPANIPESAPTNGRCLHPYGTTSVTPSTRHTPKPQSVKNADASAHPAHTLG